MCVFIGTTNSDEYLKDTTGNRRFWSVKCGTIDIDALRRDRDQLLAEAVAAFKAGEPWWLVNEADVALAKEAQAARVETDAWSERISEYLAGASDTTVATVANGIGIDTARLGKPEQMRIAAALSALGFEKSGRLRSGGNKYHRRAAA